ncbi:MAG: hypothetical protein LBB67_06740 [Oscillospiraceae bacterium]|jgi:hypothetical protein|nr:hypothetical protein [Oscillospiraceae bacterium]
MENHYKNLGTFSPDRLFYDITPPAQVIGIKIAEGSGALRRGSVMVLIVTEPEEGEDPTPPTYSLLTADPAGAPIAILCDAEDTTDAPKTVYAAYATGNFNLDALIAADGVNLRDFVKNGQLYANIFVNDPANGAEM